MSALHVVDAVLVLLSMLALVPAGVLFAELVAARPTAGVNAAATGSPMRGATPSTVVLMPAHDEAAGIALAIAAVLPQLDRGDRLLVVADNCTDATADIARGMGAEVLVRTDPVRRGKGFALDAGVRSLEGQPPDVVVVLDADCLLARTALARLASTCHSASRPVQALYLMRAPAGAALGRRLAEFAWIVKNQARPTGAAALGWPCQLMGTGMAFPWSQLRDAPLASGHLVEDMQLGLDLAAAGSAPQFCPEALVVSVFPSDREGVSTQRTRWEHGHLSVIATAAPKLLVKSLVTGDRPLLALVLDLMVPPLASFVIATGLLAVLGAISWLWGASAWPVALSTAALALSTFGIVLAWSRFGRQVVAMRELAALPFYVLAKLPVYARLVTRRQVDWVRTRRNKP